MRFLATLLFIFSFLFHQARVHAESLSVTLQVGVTEVIFAGFTSPNSQILIKEDSSVIGTTTSDSGGNWTKTISVAIPDIVHTYTLYSTDTSARQSATISYNLNVAGNTTTTVSNIVIPPTITLSGTTLAGSAYPGATLTTTSSSGDIFTTVVDSSGNWSQDLSTLEGSHTLSATMTVGSYLSLSSTSVSYAAPTPTPSSTPQPSTSSSPTSSTTTTASLASPSPTPTILASPRPFFIRLYDQNQDGKLTKVELFDTIKSWLRKLIVCDLNQDGTCNLIDLSILLYYFE